MWYSIFVSLLKTGLSIPQQTLTATYRLRTRFSVLLFILNVILVVPARQWLPFYKVACEPHSCKCTETKFLDHSVSRSFGLIVFAGTRLRPDVTEDNGMIAIFSVHGKIFIAQVMSIHKEQLLALAQVWAGPWGRISVIGTVQGRSASGCFRRRVTTFGHQALESTSQVTAMVVGPTCASLFCGWQSPSAQESAIYSTLIASNSKQPPAVVSRSCAVQV